MCPSYVSVCLSACPAGDLLFKHGTRIPQKSFWCEACRDGSWKLENKEIPAPEIKSTSHLLPPFQWILALLKFIWNAARPTRNHNIQKSSKTIFKKIRLHHFHALSVSSFHHHPLGWKFAALNLLHEILHDSSNSPGPHLLATLPNPPATYFKTQRKKTRETLLGSRCSTKLVKRKMLNTKLRENAAYLWLYDLLQLSISRTFGWVTSKQSSLRPVWFYIYIPATNINYKENQDKV